jgi:hypothetical protein
MNIIKDNESEIKRLHRKYNETIQMLENEKTVLGFNFLKI